MPRLSKKEQATVPQRVEQATFAEQPAPPPAPAKPKRWKVLTRHQFSYKGQITQFTPGSVLDEAHYDLGFIDIAKKAGLKLEEVK